MFNAFEELFAPGRKHTRDEQKRLELTREDVGDNDPGRGPIDLASGKVVVRLPDSEEPQEPQEPQESEQLEKSEGAKEPDQPGQPEKSEEPALTEE
ncbi:DUF6191 domain-containing protein [Streptomyces sp. NBC_00005]|uniref:DUF6191 domain-containing protein n=1 Tax=Streptomyces sp. NBC_00005 TaxID=2903609 RepID=UPI00324FFD2C